MPRILLIDDDQDLVEVVKSLLKKKGFDVAAFTKWNQASMAIKSFNPQLIMMDVFLSDFDGLDICKKLKRSPFTRHIPVLIFSGYPQVAEAAIYEFGADEFLAKPFEMDELIRKIHNILSKRTISA